MGRILTVLATAALFWGLYECGLLTVRRYTALVYVGHGLREARFRACSGSACRVLRLKPGHTVCFRLESELEKGRLWAEVRDAQKQSVLHLDAAQPQAELTAAGKGRYTLHLHFERATGRFALDRTETGGGKAT